MEVRVARALTFIAKDHLDNAADQCDSVLLVCGLGSRSVRDPALSAWLNLKARRVRRLGAVCRVGDAAGVRSVTRHHTRARYRELAGRV